MRVRLLGLIQALFFFAFVIVGIFALLDWAVFNGLDILAIVLFVAFLFTCYIEPRR